MSDRLRISIDLIACFLILLIGARTNRQHYTNSKVDVSWPNCSSNSDTEFSSGVVGVTGGLDFTPNLCLAQETTWFSHYSLYINTGYPGKSYGLKFASYPMHCTRTNYNCLAFNYGYNAAEYAIDYSYHQTTYSNVWWLDVETENSWTLHPLINRSVIRGTLDAIKQIPFVTQIGIYSTPNQWNSLTGSWQNKLPAWIGTGSDSKKVALNSCKITSFTGGPVLLSQYTQKIDIDISCTR